MTDKIINPDDYEWSRRGRSNKGQTKYLHLLDGNARKLEMEDYGFTKIESFRVVLGATCRKRELSYRLKVLNNHQLIFQVTGKRNS